MENIESDYHFDGYKINKISFALNPDFDGDKVNVKLNFRVRTKLFNDLSKGYLELTADINTDTDLKQEKYEAFTASVTVTGTFRNTNPPHSRKDFVSFLRLNGTATLMPFLRAAIADVTRIANIPPCVIPLINVYKMIGQPLENDMVDQ